MRNFRHYLPSFAGHFLQAWWGSGQAEEVSLSSTRNNLFNTHNNNNSVETGVDGSVLASKQVRPPLAYGEIFKNYKHKNGKIS